MSHSRTLSLCALVLVLFSAVVSAEEIYEKISPEAQQRLDDMAVAFFPLMNEIVEAGGYVTDRVMWSFDGAKATRDFKRQEIVMRMKEKSVALGPTSIEAYLKENMKQFFFLSETYLPNPDSSRRIEYRAKMAAFIAHVRQMDDYDEDLPISRPYFDYIQYIPECYSGVTADDTVRKYLPPWSLDLVQEIDSVLAFTFTALYKGYKNIPLSEEMPQDWQERSAYGISYTNLRTSYCEVLRHEVLKQVENKPLTGYDPLSPPTVPFFVPFHPFLDRAVGEQEPNIELIYRNFDRENHNALKTDQYKSFSLTEMETINGKGETFYLRTAEEMKEADRLYIRSDPSFSEDLQFMKNGKVSMNATSPFQIVLKFPDEEEVEEASWDFIQIASNGRNYFYVGPEGVEDGQMALLRTAFFQESTARKLFKIKDNKPSTLNALKDVPADFRVTAFVADACKTALQAIPSDKDYESDRQSLTDPHMAYLLDEAVDLAAYHYNILVKCVEKYSDISNVGQKADL
eukprot:TRINITY_DN1188_c0_g1_i1.p1 TRINITY_DN1188_c0_g1~~TRINITY_DN1188_c0_g1_i1.p1  ORF type:complete len:527 (-),score=148.53 TRINITY_DN1188_c0_g1_i1:194-1738(-)